MKITYRNPDDFYKGIEALVKAGLTFDADGDKLIIELTGGY